MELDFDKYCVIDGSPKTVLPSPRHRENRKSRSKPKCRNPQFTAYEDFTEIVFDRYRSASCKEFPSKKNSVESDIKRGSVYQTSRQVERMKKTGDFEGRRKIELPHGRGTALSLGILDTLCSSDDESSVGKCSDDFASLSSGPVLDERKPSLTLHKLLSAKLAMPHSLVRSESGSPKPTSPKTRFSPLRKMFDPFVKSKSMRSPLGSTVRTSEVISRSKTLRTSLLQDFSNTACVKELHSKIEKKEKLKLVDPCSPAHLHGILKLERKPGMTGFEFSLKLLEENFVAKTWKLGQLYTFQAVDQKRKSSKESSLLGQMKVSSYLCTELNSTMDEFLLFDKRIVSESEEILNRNDSSFPTEQETAAVFIQVPLDKSARSAKLHVLIPCGSHNFPAESGSVPSPLIDRWRVGGGCDCGGWDTGCPLVVFSNPDAQYGDPECPMKLFVQGKKEKTAALSIRETEDGNYAVDFHAQLSALQAFAICVAILHCKQPFSHEELEEQVSHCDSLRVFIGEEVKYLVENEESNNKIEEMQQQSFVVSPPFSPISRV